MWAWYYVDRSLQLESPSLCGGGLGKATVPHRFGKCLSGKWQSCIHWILIQPLWWLNIFHWLIWSSLPSMKALSNTLMGSHHFQETLINFLMTSWLIRRIQPRLYFWSSSTSDHSVGSPPHVRADPPLARQVHAGTGFQGLMKTWWALEVGGWLTGFLKGGCVTYRAHFMIKESLNSENIFV